MRFPVAVHKSQNSSYGVSVPSLPGCFSAGETLDAALVNVLEAIALHLECLADDGEGIPTPGGIKEYLDKDGYDDAFCWAIVEVDVPEVVGKG